MLDYGCGRGEVVEAARAAGVDMVGADIFYAGNDSRAVVTAKGILGTTVFEIHDGRLPFPDASFDLVVSNQVLEHVKDLDQVLREIARVLRPGAPLLALFPPLETWREGHCGIPFAHRFSRGSRLRFAYMLLMRSVGFGYHKDGKPKRAYVQEWIAYLDDFTSYRPMRVINATFREHFSTLRHLETDYVAYRLRHRGNARLAAMASIPPVAQLGALACRKLAGVVIIATKSAALR